LCNDEKGNLETQKVRNLLKQQSDSEKGAQKVVFLSSRMLYVFCKESKHVKEKFSESSVLSRLLSIFS
jgi:hypothetical protein